MIMSSVNTVDNSKHSSSFPRQIAALGAHAGIWDEIASEFVQDAAESGSLFSQAIKNWEKSFAFITDLYCVTEIQLTTVTIIIYSVLAPQPDQLLINTCSHQRLYKKHTGRGVSTTLLFQKPVISFHPNITLETKLNLIYPIHNVGYFLTPAFFNL